MTRRLDPLLGVFGSGDYFGGDRLGVLVGSILSAIAAGSVWQKRSQASDIDTLVAEKCVVMAATNRQ